MAGEKAVKNPGLSQYSTLPHIEKCGITSTCRNQGFHAEYWTFMDFFESWAGFSTGFSVFLCAGRWNLPKWLWTGSRNQSSEFDLLSKSEISDDVAVHWKTAKALPH